MICECDFTLLGRLIKTGSATTTTSNHDLILFAWWPRHAPEMPQDTTMFSVTRLDSQELCSGDICIRQSPPRLTATTAIADHSNNSNHRQRLVANVHPTEKTKKHRHWLVAQDVTKNHWDKHQRQRLARGVLSRHPTL